MSSAMTSVIPKARFSSVPSGTSRRWRGWEGSAAVRRERYSTKFSQREISTDCCQRIWTPERWSCGGISRRPTAWRGLLSARWHWRGGGGGKGGGGPREGGGGGGGTRPPPPPPSPPSPSPP